MYEREDDVWDYVLYKLHQILAFFYKRKNVSNKSLQLLILYVINHITCKVLKENKSFHVELQNIINTLNGSKTFFRDRFGVYGIRSNSRKATQNFPFQIHHWVLWRQKGTHQIMPKIGGTATLVKVPAKMFNIFSFREKKGVYLILNLKETWMWQRISIRIYNTY